MASETLERDPPQSTQEENGQEDGNEEASRTWEIEQGIPQPDDPFIEKYFNGRDALIAQEDKHRSDVDFRSLLSPMASEAAALVSQIRYEEQETVWSSPELEEQLAEETNREIYPGMVFSIAKKRMEQTKLWKIVRRMPKGALLHCHLEAMVPQDWLVREALKTKGIYLMAAGNLAKAIDRENEAILFVYQSEETSPSTSLWKDDYESDTPIPIEAAADSFPDGGRQGFIKWMISRLTITPDESISHHHGATAVWRKFKSVFQISGSLVWYEPIFRSYLAKFFELLVEDGVRWVDIRAGFINIFRREGHEEAEADHVYTMQCFEEELEKFQASEQGKDFWGARFIWTTLRSLDNGSIIDNMKQCIQAKIAHPHAISGYDLVGHEDPGRPLADLLPLLFWFRKQCAESGVNIPFFFHAGETLGSGSEADGNLYDAILLGTRRLGHAFSLYKHPLLMNMVKDRRICVESCPISNEVLRLTGSILSHPLPALLAHGVPVAICNDDPAILGQDTSGMSHDFFQALLAIDSLGLEGVGALAENSVRWAAFEDQEQRDWVQDVKNGQFGKGLRSKRMREWKREWETFCLWIIIEFGPDLDLEEPEVQEPEEAEVAKEKSVLRRKTRDISDDEDD